MKAIKEIAFALACGVAVAGSSQAATVHVKFDDPIFSGSGSDGVNLAVTNSGKTSTYNGIAAGRFQGTASKLNGVPSSIFVDGVSDLFMYCYDIAQHIWGGANVDYTINFTRETARTLDFLGGVNDVLNKDRKNKVYDPYAWLHGVNGNQGAAIQLGIWESLYDKGNDWGMGSGDFRATGVERATEKWLDKFTDAMKDSKSLDGQYVMVLESPDYQDMIVGDPPSVPEPGSLALLGLGLSGLAFAKRKKK